MLAIELESVRNRLAELKRKDKKCNIFGSKSHKYRLNERISEEEVSAFEKNFSVLLPLEYRQFLTEIGNGGAGPYYGLESLNDSLYTDLDYKRPGELINPSIPFPFVDAWNMEFKGDLEDDSAYEAHTAEYYSDKWETGILKVCNYGCGVSINLVVTGAEKGNMWVDDRCNDGGVYPDLYFDQTERTTFLNWYSLWLDRSLAELS